MSNTVADAIEYTHPYLKETPNFVRMFDHFFDIMNVRSMNEAMYKRKPDRRPYTPTSENNHSQIKVNIHNTSCTLGFIVCIPVNSGSLLSFFPI